jgi:hypothetical protein
MRLLHVEETRSKDKDGVKAKMRRKRSTYSALRVYETERIEMRDSYENYIATLYMHIHVYACISVYVCVYVYIYILQFKRSNAIVIKCVTRRTRSSIRSTLSSSKHYRCVAIIYYHTRSLGRRFHASAEGNPRVAIGTIGR